MATLTAQILVGHPHPNHDGILPTHYLFLSENSRPAWTLVGQNVFESRGKDAAVDRKIVWIPTVENMLEDALLMVTIHVCEDRQVGEVAKSFFAGVDAERLELYDAFTEEQRRQLYARCREIEDFPKLIVSVFGGSTIGGQLRVLKDYRMDVEVCCPVFSRLYCTWTKETRIEGRL